MSKTPFVCNWNNHLITCILLLNGDHLLKPQTANTLRVWRIQQYCGFFVWFLTLMKQRLALAYLTYICESSIIRKCRDCGCRAFIESLDSHSIYCIFHLPILKSTPYDGRTLNPAKKSKEASNEIITCNRIVSKVPQLQFEKKIR